MARTPWGVVSTQALGRQLNGVGGLRGGRLADGDGGLKFTVDGASGDLGLALQGKLQSSIDSRLKEIEGAYWRAMDRVVEAGKGRLRQDIIGGGFQNANALSKTWRGNTYPKSKDSLEVAGWIYTRASLIIDAFSAATVIKVRGNAQFLAIPQGPAKAIVRRLQKQKKKGLIGRNAWGRFEKDDSYVEQVAAALGVELVPIIAPDRQTGVLIAASRTTLTPTGREAKNQNRAATVLFSLTKTATLKKRIKGRALLDEILQHFPGDFAHALAGELATQEP